MRLKLFHSNNFERVFHSCLEINKSGWSSLMLCVVLSGLILKQCCEGRGHTVLDR